jgi:hypothetical protein
MTAAATAALVSEPCRQYGVWALQQWGWVNRSVGSTFLAAAIFTVSTALFSATLTHAAALQHMCMKLSILESQHCGVGGPG